MDSNDNKNGEEHRHGPNARKCKLDELTKPADEGQQKANCTEKKNDGKKSNIELESLQREELIKLVKETKMQLETAKFEMEQKTKENDTLHNQLNELRNEQQILLPVNQMKVKLPSENWFDLLAFVPRSQLSKIVPKIGNRQFARIVQTFLHEYGEITLNKIKIMEPYNEHPSDNGCPRVRVWQKQMHRLLRFKLTDAQMPKNITNFKSIKLSYLDTSVMNFLHQFQQNLLLENVNLYVRELPGFLPGILPVIASINSIVIVISSNLHQLIGICDNPKEKSNGISQMLNTKMAQARIMQIIGYHIRRFNSLDWCCRWLYSNTQDGRPRILIITIICDDIAQIYSTVFNRIKQDFLTATRAVSFFVGIDIVLTNIFEWDQEIYSLENRKTSEKLMVKEGDIRIREFACIKLKRMLISRYPSGAAKQWIKQNEEEVLDWGLADQNRQIEF